MCELCDKAKASPTYQSQLKDWFARDVGRLAATRAQAADNPTLANSFLSNLGFPPDVSMPLFEPRISTPSPSNYFQNAFVDGVRLHSGWTHDCARSVGFFENGDLLFITKAVARSVGMPEYFFYLYVIRFEKAKGEFNLSVDASGKAVMEANSQKGGTNILSGSPASHLFSFSFQHFPTNNAILPKERAATYYAQRAAAHAPGRASQPTAPGFGGVPPSAAAPRALPARTSGSSFEEYVVTVPHFAPHPYLLQAYQELGFASRMELQNAVSKFFKDHAQG
ncbi:MAG: hypothetical protein QXH27_01260 [Candidatus Micrarchaeia archaeon]